jgi:hypothetical protein
LRCRRSNRRPARLAAIRNDTGPRRHPTVEHWSACHPLHVRRSFRGISQATIPERFDQKKGRSAEAAFHRIRPPGERRAILSQPEPISGCIVAGANRAYSPAGSSQG